MKYNGVIIQPIELLNTNIIGHLQLVDSTLRHTSPQPLRQRVVQRRSMREFTGPEAIAC